VLDARDAEGSRNEEAEQIIKELGKSLVFVLTKTDLVPEAEVGVIRNRLNKSFPTVTFRNNDTQFLGKLKKAFSEEKGKLQKFNKESETKLIGVFGYPFVGKETLLDKIAKMVEKPEKDNQQNEEAMEVDSEEGEAEMEEAEESQEEQEAEDIIIGHGYSIVKLAAQTVKKDQSKTSLIMQSVFSVSEILPRKQLTLLLDTSICAKKELCRSYRIPISFTDVDSFLTFI